MQRSRSTAGEGEDGADGVDTGHGRRERARGAPGVRDRVATRRRGERTGRCRAYRGATGTEEKRPATPAADGR